VGKAAQGCERSTALLKEIRKCRCCGTLNVHHLKCPLCRSVRYCNREYQLAHWRCPTNPHKDKCSRRLEEAENDDDDTAAPAAATPATT